jgi:hypothetical protein
LSKKGAQKLLSIETIKQPLDDEMLELSHKEILEGYFLETAFFTYDEKRSPSLRERKKALTAMMLDFPAWSEPNKKRIKELIRILAEIANQANIQLVLHGGTLLGHVRHAGIMPWDDDVDLGIYHKELDSFIQAVHEDGRVKYACLVHKKEISTTDYYKFWLQDGEAIEGYNYTFPFVDLWSYYENDQYFFYAEGYNYPKALYYPLRPATFEDSWLYVPNKPLETLDIFYGTSWRHMIVIYPWSHREEKAVHKTWKLPIQIDQQGRAVFD